MRKVEAASVVQDVVVGFAARLCADGRWGKIGKERGLFILMRSSEMPLLSQQKPQVASLSSMILSSTIKFDQGMKTRIRLLSYPINKMVDSARVFERNQLK